MHASQTGAGERREISAATGSDMDVKEQIDAAISISRKTRLRPSHKCPRAAIAGLGRPLRLPGSRVFQHLGLVNRKTKQRRSRAAIAPLTSFKAIKAIKAIGHTSSAAPCPAPMTTSISTSPIDTPRTCGSERARPKFVPDDISMRLFGRGVIEETNTKAASAASVSGGSMLQG